MKQLSLLPERPSRDVFMAGLKRCRAALELARVSSLKGAGK